MNEYETGIAWLESLASQPLIPARTVGLARAERLLAELDNPHRHFRSVHVAGSTGKGSTATFAASILKAAGYRTGLFRSPHLWTYTERIEVNGSDISRDTWTAAMTAVRSVANHMIAGTLPAYTLGRPSFFEVLFAMAAYVFREAGLQWAVIETGMGGRLDATNTLQSDVAVVTNVSLEHTQVLGTTIAAIAQEKAAIIKPGATAVTACTAEALAIMRSRARDVDAPLLAVPADVRATVLSHSLEGQVIALDALDDHLDVCLKMIGPTQPVNAACAFGAALQLRRRGVDLSFAAIEHGLGAAVLPGRFEIVGRDPITLLDGAHSVAGAQALAAFLQSTSVPGKRRLVFTAMADKNVEAMARALAPTADEVIVTRVPGTARGADLERLRHAFADTGTAVTMEENPALAIEVARSKSGPEDWTVVAGSLYLVGFAREVMRCRELD